jgi:hypothetical protein
LALGLIVVASAWDERGTRCFRGPWPGIDLNDFRVIRGRPQEWACAGVIIGLAGDMNFLVREQVEPGVVHAGGEVAGHSHKDQYIRRSHREEEG